MHVWKSTPRCPRGRSGCLGSPSCLGCDLKSVSQSQRGQDQHPVHRERNTTSLRPQWMTHMAGLAALCLLLAFPLSSSQSTPQSEQKVTAAEPPPPPPPPPPRLRDVLREDETTHFNAEQTYAHTGKDNAKVGVFVAASIGTLALMAAVYCIYNRFYTKQRHHHTQLENDSDLTIDPPDPPPVFFHASVGSSAAAVRRDAYGSLSDTPSIICVPPSLSPPPSAMPFPPRFPTSRSLRTISAKDLEGSYV